MKFNIVKLISILYSLDAKPLINKHLFGIWTECVKHKDRLNRLSVIKSKVFIQTLNKKIQIPQKSNEMLSTTLVYDQCVCFAGPDSIFCWPLQYLIVFSVLCTARLWISSSTQTANKSLYTVLYFNLIIYQMFSPKRLKQNIWLIHQKEYNISSGTK